VDEIKLFEELQPPSPPSALRMREAARARLTAATSAPVEYPARRRSTVVAIAAAGALVAGGASYGLAAAGSGGARPAGSSRLPVATAGLTAVQGCPGEYVTAGTLNQVSGTQLTIQSANDTDQVTVATNTSTKITIPATGTVSDITDGSRVTVQGSWSGRSLAATKVAVQAGLPPAGSIGPRFHGGHLRTLRPPKGVPPQGPPFVTGTVRDARGGGFTVVAQHPLGPARRVQVVTSSSTKVTTDASATLSQLTLGSNVVAVGPIGHGGVMTAATVTEPSGGQVMLPRGLVKIRSHGCSAAAITTAAILASS
jgi:hypothetical protein